MYSLISSPFSNCPKLRDVKDRLQLNNQLPLVVGYVLPVEFLQTVNGGTRDLTVQQVRLLELSAVGRLMAAHFNLDGDGGLALLAHVDLFVFTFDRCPVMVG